MCLVHYLQKNQFNLFSHRRNLCAVVNLAHILSKYKDKLGTKSVQQKQDKRYFYESTKKCLLSTLVRVEIISVSFVEKQCIK